MNLPNMDWTPIHNTKWELSTCKPIDHPEYIMPYGQTVVNESIADGSQYDCLNRGDENPFFIRNSESNGTDADSLTWTQWVNTLCENPEFERRCLGLRPDICAIDVCKYSIFKQSEPEWNFIST